MVVLSKFVRSEQVPERILSPSGRMAEADSRCLLMMFDYMTFNSEEAAQPVAWSSRVKARRVLPAVPAAAVTACGLRRE